MRIGWTGNGVWCDMSCLVLCRLDLILITYTKKGCNKEGAPGRFLSDTSFFSDDIYLKSSV